MFNNFIGKKKYFELSKKGTNKGWCGINSNSINFYYDKIKEEDKDKFDNYIKMKLNMI
jgi:hypothetical protein